MNFLKALNGKGKIGETLKIRMPSEPFFPNRIPR